jgi:betaine-aldehyde dehydrogenase
MGGWKASGIGARNNGPYGMLKYCRAQAVTVDRVAPQRELTWFPYTPTGTRVMRRALRLLNARGSRRLR